MAFNKFYQYAGIKAGYMCYGSNKKIGKFGTSSKCNYKCANGKDNCGGASQNSAYRLDYVKDRLCSIEQKYEMTDANGAIVYGRGGELTNPSGDGENFVIVPDSAEGEIMELVVVRTREGTIKGFKVTDENSTAYESGFTFLSYYEEDGYSELFANGVTYISVD